MFFNREVGLLNKKKALCANNFVLWQVGDLLHTIVLLQC